MSHFREGSTLPNNASIDSALPSVIDGKKQDCEFTSLNGSFLDDPSLETDLLIRFGQDPSAEGEQDPVAFFLYQKYLDMSTPKAFEILKGVVTDHKDDVNFPSDVMKKVERLVERYESVGGDLRAFNESFENDSGSSSDLSEEGSVAENSKFSQTTEAKIEAVLVHFHSPYPEVRAVTDPFDDPDMPCETIRAYFLGFLWTIIGSGVNQFFSPRKPAIKLTSGILQIFLLPCGRLLEKVLPDWGITIRGKRHSLNPGPFTYKEQMLATIIFNVSITGAYVAYYNIFADKLPQFYNSQWATVGYHFMLTFSTQFIGFGFAGVMRRLIVYPVSAVWPTILPTLALNKALAAKEPKKNINGWTISRYSFFLVAFAIAFVYFWIPNYLFEALGDFNWITWIAPKNYDLAIITGSLNGLGLNPIPTFDWTIINYNNPMVVPFYTSFNTYLGMLVSFIVIPALFYTNTKWSAYFPVNSNRIFANDGTSYNVSKILTNGLFDNKKYQQYSPPFYSAANLVCYAAHFMLYPFAIIYTFLTDWTAIKRCGMDIYTTVRNPRRSNYAGHQDIHSQMMSKYKEVPDWWFFVILLISLAIGIAMVEYYPTNTPVWGIFFALGINFVFLIPITLIYSVTGFSFGLNVLVELIVGYALPGNGTALNILKAYGYNIDSQAESYVSDQKMGHYAKIPPRAMFAGQMISTLLQVLVSVGIVNWQMSNIDNICMPNQAQKFTCPGVNTFYSSSVFWGVIGPKRVFDGLYPALRWCFLIGALLPFPLFYLRKYVFPKTLKYFQPTIVIGAMYNFAPFNLVYYTSGLYVAFAFNYYIRSRFQKWWEKYNFVLSASITSGVALSAIIIFFAVQYHPKKLEWWGNTVPYRGMDYKNLPLMKIPKGTIVGPERGQFP